MSFKKRENTHELVVVGTGAAGLFTTLAAAEMGAKVTLVSATQLAQTASYWAQGGAAAALTTDDSAQLHVQDTVEAGRGLVNQRAAEILCQEAPEIIAELQHFGMIFDHDRSGKLSLSLEGGHRHRRVVHAGGSATGRRLIRHLSAQVVNHKNISIREQTPVTKIVSNGYRCSGVKTEHDYLTAHAVILATGGYAAAWQRTTNPPGSTGAGLLLAHGAGATLADLEFMQFHPTAVTGIPGLEGFLITEAIRGEGATLQTEEGNQFVDELAPRDTVTYAIEQQLLKNKTIWLDMRSINLNLFPNITSTLREKGYDPKRTRIPVSPAAHYSIGGIATNLHGETNVKGLFAVGEAACTGLHGANRLASNSLSECFVFGKRAVQKALSQSHIEPPLAINQCLPDPQAFPPLDRSALSKYAGPIRNAQGLKTLAKSHHPLLRWIASSALAREESRGVHVRDDFPKSDERFYQRHSKLYGEDSIRFEKLAS